MRILRRAVAPDIVWLCCLYVWVAVFSYPYFAHALTDNLREIRSYNLDAGDALQAVEDALRARLFHIRFNDYGHFYSNLSIVAALVYSVFRPLTEHALFFIIRLNALIGGCAAIAITYIFAKHFLGRGAAVFASLIMAVSPAFLQYSNEAKPDSWQIFFVVLSLYGLARAYEARGSENPVSGWKIPPANFGFMLWAAAAAGAAFGTKYLGMFLLPQIGLAALGVAPEEISPALWDRVKRSYAVIAPPLGLGLIVLAYAADPRRVFHFLNMATLIGTEPAQSVLLSGRIVTAALGTLLLVGWAFHRAGGDAARFERGLKKSFILVSAPVVFFGVFFLSSPWMLYGFPFVREIFLRNGYVTDADRFGSAWFSYLFADAMYVGPVIGVVAGVGALLLVYQIVRHGHRGRLFPLNGVLIFTAIFLLLLIVKVNRATVLYGLPMVPLAALLAAVALHEAVRLVFGKTSANILVATVVAGVVLLASQIWYGSARLIAYPNLVTQLSPDNARLSAWIERCVPATAPVLTGSYGYVPPKITSYVMGDGLFYYNEVYPDVVIVNSSVRADTEQAAMKNPAARDKDRFALYDLLRDAARWSPGPDFGIFQAYVKRGGRVNPGCR